MHKGYWENGDVFSQFMDCGVIFTLFLYSRSYQAYASIRPPEGCHVALASRLPAQLKPKGVDFILGIGSFGLVYFHDIL